MPHLPRPFARLRVLTAAVVFVAGLASVAAQPAPTPSPPPSPAADTTDAGAAPLPTPDADILDVDQLRQEYVRLRDELFVSRAKAAVVASALYSSQLTVRFHFASGRFHAVDRASVRLDGASVYDDRDGQISLDKAVRFTGFVAPGRHEVTFALATQAKDDAGFATRVEQTLVIDVPTGKDVEVIASARDDGDIAYQWKKKARGSYKLGLTVDVKATDASKRAPSSASAARAVPAEAHAAR